MLVLVAVLSVLHQSNLAGVQGFTAWLDPLPLHGAGGAWTIGYKAWGALLARRLCDAGVIVACLDYRNFPQVTCTGVGSGVDSKHYQHVCRPAC